MGSEMCIRDRVIPSPGKILIFLMLGFTGYFIAQGLQFFSLYYLPAITVTFILNMTPIFVLVLSILFLGEKPTFMQLVGIVLVVCGVTLFFSGSRLVFSDAFSVLLTMLSSIGWASYMIISRHYLRNGEVDLFVLTSYSMSLGSLMLLGTAILSSSLASPSMDGWLLILWLSVVNTALAFALWNHSLNNAKSLRAVYIAEYDANTNHFASNDVSWRGCYSSEDSRYNNSSHRSTISTIINLNILRMIRTLLISLR